MRRTASNCSNRGRSCCASPSAARFCSRATRRRGLGRWNGCSPPSTRSSRRILELAAIDLFYSGQEWAKLRRPGAEAGVRKRLAELAAALGDKAHLDGPRFTAGDLMMATVLRILRHTGLVAEQPALADWLERCEARPAFQRALAGQMAGFEPAA